MQVMQRTSRLINGRELESSCVLCTFRLSIAASVVVQILTRRRGLQFGVDSVSAVRERSIAQESIKLKREKC
ncbi:hypothetical protein RHGRI_005925 [Rhododendron griersonianum]|uniref:Uncharacterized protein n=1 Tax=Rhododendron griersonianum TaxID=479676 RepID=A0AAV6LEY9_9ERIC|nr:hypothetical protein RHGRI_005925 [Rhododendron griersonianum]